MRQVYAVGVLWAYVLVELFIQNESNGSSVMSWSPEGSHGKDSLQPSCTDFIYGAATEPATRVQCPPTDWKNRRPLNWMNQCDSVTCRRAPPAGQQSAHGRLPADDEVTRLCQCWPKEAALSCHSAFRPPRSDRLNFPFLDHEQIKITLNELTKSFAY